MKLIPFTNRNTILLLLFITLCNDSFSQKERNIWYFGDFAGLDFNSGIPVALTNSNMSTYDNCASVADCNGALLFYSNGVNVWNKNHAIMPNGSGLLGNTSGGNSAFSVKQPGVNSFYYLFTIDFGAGPNGLRYSIIDIDLQGGLGDVTSTKNKILVNPSTEKITAIVHSNKSDIWIITHPWNSNSFYSFLLTDSGLDTVPQISTIGSMHSGSISNSSGQISASQSGNKIVCAIYDLQQYELFDFNKTTGVLSNLITFSDYPRAWGTEFSPDGTKLYISQWTYSDIIQFDISSGVQSTILSSEITIGTVTGPNSLYKAGYLQVGPDGKIYIAKYESDYLGVIVSPNNSGITSNFIDNGVFLSNKKSLAGLPSFLSSSSSPIFFSLSPLTPSICSGDTVTLTASGATYYSWSPSTGLNATSGDTVIAYPDFTTNYKVVGTNSAGCSDSVEVTVTVQPSPNSAFNYTISCKTVEFINSDSLTKLFLWNFGDGDTSFISNPQHLYADTGNYSVMLVTKSTNCGNDTSYQNITISPPIKAQFSYSVDTCASIVNFINLSPDVNTFLWEFGDNSNSTIKNPSHPYTVSGNYSVNFIVNSGTECADSIQHTIAIGADWLNSTIFIPNAFTPNGDGVNDKFEILQNYSCGQYTFFIFNRWGQLLITLTDLTQPWEGKLNGNVIPEGVYVYLLRSVQNVKTGTLTVIR
ncbi:MAG: hypothetical protein A3H98_13855 [Bacteroidetes bacterium RIFCSPLOWO2_02_FULL_36_8]|nr:MAG: hypothetical protein A3H98_13855 [Bacteroidetes bacterium RIFCSPLOWO2_02_FULL_36_8]OFY70982.1 MAG: hypothetical protein A3G23_12770 [Bacteroidetes bacterium RIFCSPLOWO2_12_FULL_37_12]